MKNKVTAVFILAICAFVLVLLINMGVVQISGHTLGKVVGTDDSNLIVAGISKIGSQSLRVEVINGNHKGEIVDTINNMSGKMDFDNYYKVGDKLLLDVHESHSSNDVQGIAIDLFRFNYHLIIGVLFLILLISYAGITGLKAMLSFGMTVCIIWYILIPGLLRGISPIYLTTSIILLLTAIIIFTVSGINKKTISAVIGTVCGITITVFVTKIFTDNMGLYGMTAPFAETLLFSGYLGLNMKDIFISAIILGASGAAMDIAVDVSASMEEILAKKPDIGRKELVDSGLKIGKQVIGTMSTTLLLAYSGGYLTLLMLFIAKDSSVLRIMNLKLVSAEILRTMCGSICLVIVAPVTAIVAGFVLTSSWDGFNITIYKAKHSSTRRII